MIEHLRRQTIVGDADPQHAAGFVEQMDRITGMKMNLVINDTDHPLIIKVASIQAARMQVYFIDNEDYFHRKATVKDAKEKFFADPAKHSLILFSRTCYHQPW